VHCEFPHQEFRKLCRISILKPKIYFCATFLVHNQLLEYGLLLQGKSEEVKLLQIGVIFGVLQDDARIKIMRGGVPEDFKYFSRQDIRFFVPTLAKTKYT
jgi:hypothetical protein